MAEASVPNITYEEVPASGFRFSYMTDEGKEVGRTFLYILQNDPVGEGTARRTFGFIEDVAVDKAYERLGIGTALMQAAIDMAQSLGCYKVVWTSRLDRAGVHEWYLKSKYGKFGCPEIRGVEFRLNLT